MNNDKDLIRVDLLKFRRKAYLSYAENSLERKNFLKIILQNELQLTKSEIPHDLINLVLEGDKVMWWNALKYFGLWICASILFLTMAVLIYPILHSFAFVFVGMGIGAFTIGIQYL